LIKQTVDGIVYTEPDKGLTYFDIGFKEQHIAPKSPKSMLKYTLAQDIDQWQFPQDQGNNIPRGTMWSLIMESNMQDGINPINKSLRYRVSCHVSHM
jgi:hypothetical protein